MGTGGDVMKCKFYVSYRVPPTAPKTTLFVKFIAKQYQNRQANQNGKTEKMLNHGTIIFFIFDIRAIDPMIVFSVFRSKHKFQQTVCCGFTKNWQFNTFSVCGFGHRLLGMFGLFSSAPGDSALDLFFCFLAPGISPNLIQTLV